MRILKLLTVAVVGLAFLTPIINPSKAEALSGNQFQAGRIIDDSVFFNSGSMSTSSIQHFLNSKVPFCDTNGSQAYGGSTRAAHGSSRGYPPPYTCLRNYSQATPSRGAEAGLCGAYHGGTKSAAQIINDVARSCGISQKALIVLLEKEQSLVTDNWPWAIQYRSATGYGCPDTAPCDSDYYGFFNQVYNAARQFKRYIKDAHVFSYRAGRSNYIQYNPNAGCGGTNVVIFNNATAALYNYTPYQPNPSALANLYGSGDACGAYGNRNFWRIFNDWFGGTNASTASQSPYARAACTIPGFNSKFVGRLYQSETKDYLYTTSRSEACAAVRFGYAWDGIVMKNAASGSGRIPVYRLADQVRHVYTSSPSVKADYIQNKGFHDEGIGFYAYSSAAPGRSPVYCLVEDLTVAYTSAGGEKTYFEQFFGFNTVGTAFFTETMGSPKTRVFRLNRWNYDRLYTTNQMEAVQAISYGYGEEASNMLADTSPAASSTLVYRLRGPDGRHFYTRNRHERDLAVIYYNYFGEGAGFYAPISTTAGAGPIHRLSNYQNGGRLFTRSNAEKNSARIQYGYKHEGISWYSY